MSTVSDTPHLTDEGIAFTVAVGFVKCKCLIPKQTLSYICRIRGHETDDMKTFRAHEDIIFSIARRMVIAGAARSPLILERKFFPW